jgi:hypothetical protein
MQRNPPEQAVMRRRLGVALVLALLTAPAAASAKASGSAALSQAIDRYWHALGFNRSAASAVAAANLPGSVSRALANELGQLYRCDAVTRSHIDDVVALFGGQTGFPLGQPPVNPVPVQRQGSTVLGVPIPPAPNPPHNPEYPFEPQVEACGGKAVFELDALEGVIRHHHVRASSGLDLWPVLRFEPSKAGHHTYRNDYVLLVDEGPNNTFLNNAGGSGLDIWRGPAGQHPPIVAPARGCIDAFDIIRKRTCTLASAALLDLGGHNTYGRKQAPDPQTDGVCTADSLEPRVFVQGTGVAGVGLLIDEGSYNTFTGKVLTTGTAHIGGYGYLRVDGSHNSYTVIRDGLGDAVVGGTGYLIANGDYNTYSYYDPSPISPFAQPGYPGGGGVVDDLNNCDPGTGITLGSGEVGGVGHFGAIGGHNSYSAPIDSLGSGTVGGQGAFSDTGSGGTDSYSGPGATGRGPGVTLGPTPDNNGSFTDS